MGCPQVCAGATLQCSFGAAPTVLNVLPQNRTLTSGMPAAKLPVSDSLKSVKPWALKIVVTMSLVARFWNTRLLLARVSHQSHGLSTS